MNSRSRLPGVPATHRGLLTILCGLVLPAAPSAGHAADALTATHIARIENGLLPVAIVRNRPAPRLALSARMEHYKVPAVSVAFIDQGEIAWVRAYGMADIAGDRAAAPATLFQAASITKPVFATAVLQAVEQGKLSLDAPINTYLTSWKLPENGFTARQPVTLRRLLSHTAGVTVHGFEGYPGGTTDLPSVPQMLSGEKPANNDRVLVELVPGTAVQYSGGGYLLARLALTDVLHRSLEEIVRQGVLIPAGMSNSTMQQPLPGNLLTRAAVPYAQDGSPVPGGPHIYPEGAPDGLWTTAADLARFAIAIQKAYAGISTTLLSRTTARMMLTSEEEDQGLGFSLRTTSGRASFSHNGGNVGYRCDLFAYADMGQGIVIMTNSENGVPLIREIEQAASAEYGWPDFRPAERDSVQWPEGTLDRIAGTFKCDHPDLQPITIRVEDGKGILVAPDLSVAPMPLVPESDHSFFLPDMNFGVSFPPGTGGPITSITLSAYGQEYPAHRVPSR